MSPTKLTLLLASSLTVMSGALVSPALPAIQASFAGDVARVELLTRMILTLPALGIVVGAPLAGRYLNTHRRRPVLLAALVGYAVVGTAGFLLPSLYGILASRFLLGLAVAVILPTTVTLVGEYFEGEERESFLGLQGAFMALGGTVFVAVSGVLAGLGWRYVFLVYAFALIVGVLAYRYLPEPARQPQSEHSGATENGAAGLSREVWLTYAWVLLSMVAFYLVPVQSSFVMEAVGVEAEWLLGAGLILATVVSAVVSANFGRLSARFTAGQLFALVFLGMGAGFVVIGSYPSVATALIGSAIVGAATGIVMPNGNAHLIDITPPAQRAGALGGLATAIFLGQFLSPLAFQPVAAAAGGLLRGHLWFGACTLVVAGLAWWVYRGRASAVP